MQAQVVLQGKSRSVIIRELQRTNLDVNLAVNNLLSRDDEDGDDGDDTASESYLPGGWWIPLWFPRLWRERFFNGNGILKYSEYFDFNFQGGRYFTL